MQMYSTCIFCQRSLGKNAVLESLPIGRRIAFDPEKGRLWIVCPRCRRWNLSPIEERWESVEYCERLFSQTALRYGTQNIGLARLKGGVSLVRIGRPLRSEMAAWRYGDQIRARWRRRAFYGSALATAGAFITLGPTIGMLGGSAWALGSFGAMVAALKRTTSLRVQGRVILLNEFSIAAVSLYPRPNGEWSLAVPYTPGLAGRKTGDVSVTSRGHGRHALLADGEDALSALRVILPRINYWGASKSLVSEAVRLLEDGAPNQSPLERASIAPRTSKRQLFGDVPYFSVLQIAPAHRLALEMSINEADEQLSLTSDLTALTERWKEAEEIAAIADDLLFPENLLQRLKF